MGAAMGQRNDVVDFLSRGEDTAFVALLAEGVGGGVSVTDALPRSAVAPLGGGVPLVAFVAAVLLLGVCLAEPPIGQVGTAGETAGAAGHLRHGVHLHWGKRKATAGGSSHDDCPSFCSKSNDTRMAYSISLYFTVKFPAPPFFSEPWHGVGRCFWCWYTSQRRCPPTARS